MSKNVFLLVLAISVTPAMGQSRRAESVASASTAKRVAFTNPFAGKWTYRSYHNRPEVIVDQDAAAALRLLFGEGVMTFENTDLKLVKGTFDMGGGYLLDLEGTVRWQTYAAPAIFEISGKGRAGTPTEGWQYDYVGYLAWQWPNGINQVPAIVGTVIRTKPHGNSPAGYVASFIAAKQP